MANLTQHLTSISPDLRSGSSPGRRLLAVTLCSMLIVGSVLPGAALADESDSEGEASSPSIELPEPPDFDPGGEETDLEEEAPATGSDEEEVGAVEVEPEIDTEAPLPAEVTSAATEAPPQPAAVPKPTISAPGPEPEPVQQAEAEPPSPAPIANQAITAPRSVPDRHPVSAKATEEAAPPSEPARPEAPQPKPQPQPVAATPTDSGRSLAGKDTYVVQPGDCLWRIAAGLLPAGAGTDAVAQEVERLWRLNEDRIGTGDPNLIYAGTELRLR
jgi:outer membrane biosynthesis protein TonB